MVAPVLLILVILLQVLHYSLSFLYKKNGEGGVRKRKKILCVAHEKWVPQVSSLHGCKDKLADLERVCLNFRKPKGK